jgi:hypothetical protein
MSWQSDYEQAVELGNAPAGYGRVVRAVGRVSLYGTTLDVQFEDGRILSPYFNQGGFEPDGDRPSEADEIREDPEEWADNRNGATAWAMWEWVKGGWA